MNLTGLKAFREAGEGKAIFSARPRVRVLLMSVFAASFACGPDAFAATSSVIFSGSVTVNNTCSINVINDGRFGLSANARQLSSKLAGGLSAKADIVSTRNFRISAIAVPTLTSHPVGGNTGVTMASRYSGQSISNGRTFGERNGTSRVTLRNGLSTTRVTVHLSATRTGSAFPSGYYQGTVTIRCE